jgi:hypothetical protein
MQERCSLSTGVMAQGRERNISGGHNRQYDAEVERRPWNMVIVEKGRADRYEVKDNK